MWAALGVAGVAIIMAVMTFRSRTIWIARAVKAETENDEHDELIEALLEEIEALSLGDHGLEHDDILDVLLPGNLRDDARDDS